MAEGMQQLWQTPMMMNVRFAKLLLRSNISHPLFIEELCTLLCQIEKILNSRPICPLSEDPNDEFFLIPVHFCLGGKLENLLEPDY